MKPPYKRYCELEISNLCSYFPVVGLIGARQVGKTTLCKMIQTRTGKQTHYLDLELNSDLNKLGRAELYLSRFKNQCVIIDEIQRKPELFPLLRALVDQTGDSCQFIITGSASPDLIQQSTESLAGRIAYVVIHPFADQELPPFISLESHWFRGGFPKALFAPNDNLAQKWIANFVTSYLERDLRLLGLSAEPLLLRRLWMMLAHTHGNIIKFSALSSSLGISINTVRRYVDFFEQAFLIRRLNPHFSNFKKKLVKSPKFFLQDSGILHQLLSIGSLEELFGHPSMGNSWEGYCISQIMGVVQNHYEAAFYRTHDGAECDLVLSRSGSVKYALEFKFSDSPTLTKGNTEAFKSIESKENYVVVPKGESYQLNEMVRVINIHNFISSLLIERE
ncbi:MAG: ATP-binding protein [Candidatus Marinimicrobia bacterium]|nr:ATP-binding protein [Candidatus Neomarinimicrobiota bacterium]